MTTYAGDVDIVEYVRLFLIAKITDDWEPCNRFLETVPESAWDRRFGMNRERQPPARSGK